MTSPRPTFLIAGASRSGTTSLTHYLRNHPEIYIPAEKELRFFDQDARYSRGLDFYEGLFDGWSGEPVVGECSPPYFNRAITFDRDGAYQWSPEDDAPARIRQAYPELKIVLTLRDPVTRGYSQFWKNVRQGRERASSYREALRSELAGDRRPESHPYCWIYRNRYSVHLDRWLELFEREQLRVTIFEEWIEEPRHCVEQVAAYLGVSSKIRFAGKERVLNRGRTPRTRLGARLLRWMDGWVGLRPIRAAIRKANERSGYPEMDEATRRLAEEVLTPEREAVEDLLGRRIEAWWDG